MAIVDGRCCASHDGDAEHRHLFAIFRDALLRGIGRLRLGVGRTDNNPQIPSTATSNRLCMETSCDGGRKDQTIHHPSRFLARFGFAKQTSLLSILEGVGEVTELEERAQLFRTQRAIFTT